MGRDQEIWKLMMGERGRITLIFYDFEKVEKISVFTLTIFLPKKFEKILSPIFKIKSYQDMFVEVQDVEKHKFFRF